MMGWIRWVVLDRLSAHLATSRGNAGALLCAGVVGLDDAAADAVADGAAVGVEGGFLFALSHRPWRRRS